MLPSRTGPRRASQGTTATPSSAERTMPRSQLAAARNIAKTALLLGGFTAAFTLLGWWLGGARAGGVLLVVALLSSGMLVYSGDRVILGMLGARELLPADAPAFASMVERLARRVGTGAVKLAVIDDGHPRALAVGRTPNRSTLVISRGLLSMAAPAELEGVVAHELAHIRHWGRPRTDGHGRHHRRDPRDEQARSGLPAATARRSRTACSKSREPHTLAAA